MAHQSDPICSQLIRRLTRQCNSTDTTLCSSSASTSCRCRLAPGEGTGPTVRVLFLVGRVPTRRGLRTNRLHRDAQILKRACACEKKRYPRVEDTFWDSLVVELAQALLVTRRRRAKNPKATGLSLATPVPADGRRAFPK